MILHGVARNIQDGLYLIEIDRVLRPGGYLVLSGPPISWQTSYKGWRRPAKDLENEQNQLEDLARRLCWKKVAERGPIAVWRKPTNHIHCAKMMRTWKAPRFCVGSDADVGWYNYFWPLPILFYYMLHISGFETHCRAFVC